MVGNVVTSLGCLISKVSIKCHLSRNLKEVRMQNDLLLIMLINLIVHSLIWHHLLHRNPITFLKKISFLILLDECFSSYRMQPISVSWNLASHYPPFVNTIEVKVSEIRVLSPEIFGCVCFLVFTSWIVIILILCCCKKHSITIILNSYFIYFHLKSPNLLPLLLSVDNTFI